jgi:hypothetical protein
VVPSGVQGRGEGAGGLVVPPLVVLQVAQLHEVVGLRGAVVRRERAC